MLNRAQKEVNKSVACHSASFTGFTLIALFSGAIVIDCHENGNKFMSPICNEYSKNSNYAVLAVIMVVLGSYAAMYSASSNIANNPQSLFCCCKTESPGNDPTKKNLLDADTSLETGMKKK